MTPNQVVVLGGSGDIGSVIVRHLKNSGIHCIAPSSKQVDLKNSIESKSFFSTINGPFELVFAALDRSILNGESVSSTNLRMVENAISFGTPNSLIFLSSIDVYGKSPKIPITEKSILSGDLPYGSQKIIAERVLSDRFGSKIPLLILRLPGVYGGGSLRNSALEKILRKGFISGVVELGQSGRTLRDWIYAEELGRFVTHFCGSQYSGTFNFVTGKSISIDSYVSKCLGVFSTIKHKVLNSRGDTLENSSDFVFDDALLRENFPNWKFSDRDSSLISFSKEYLGSLRKSNKIK
jgi:nucleoside-diphosphate-sugar epimerase